MIRTYRCACGWSARRKPLATAIECGECHRLAEVVDPKPGPKPAPPEERREEMRIRPLVSAIAELGVERARDVAVLAVERAARNAKARRA
jgi:hypothetical protein